MYARGVRRFVVAAVLGLSVTACAADGTSAPAGTAAAEGAGSTASATYDLVGGSTVDLSVLQAERPVALWFWAPG